ncbi:MAG: hypothetical protein RJA19_285 [Bacteroidota bacterium]|jgi:hypothetical protein
MNKHILLGMLAALSCTAPSWAGNPDRAGSAGAGQLLINPWAMSNGLAGTNMATSIGLESTFLNVAGLAFIERMDLAFANTRYLSGSDISVNSVGFATKVGESSVLGLTVMSMRFGDIPITTVDLPEGGIGTFSPAFSNIGVSYAKAFSNSIYGGLTLRIIGESISNVRASGVAFDAGIRYVSPNDDRLKFGIALRNVGAPMRFAGDGLTVTATPQGSANSLTVLQRSEKYELPSLVNIGFGYDVTRTETLRATVTGQFVSNSFTRDQFGGGVEVDWKEMLVLRAGYMWEDGIGQESGTATAFTGPSAGLTFQLPAGQDGGRIGVDYGFRATNPFGGNHSLGLHITL